MSEDSVGLDIGAFLHIGQEAVKELKGIGSNNLEARGIFKALVQALPNINASGNQTVDFGAPSKGRMWMVRELIAFEAGQEFTQPNSAQASATGAAGASTTATLPFFSPTLTGFDVSVQPATAAGTAVITVTGSGKPTLTYYLTESTTTAVTLSKTFGGLGLVGYTAVNIAALASGGIPTVNVTGVQAGSPAQVGWYVGAPDTSIGLVSSKPPTAAFRWAQGLSMENQDLFMPFFSTFGNRVFPVTAPDHLLAFVNGAIGGENFTLIAVVEEYRIPDMASMRA